MADEITIISSTIEIHPTTNDRFAVVRNGQVYAELDTHGEAVGLAEELAEREEE
jgi:hypothetical protein